MTSSQIPQLDRDKLLQLIKEEGLLSHSLPGFESRLQQQQMMGNVIDAYNHSQITLIEAGTGTGKSLAYLIPALMWAAQYQERTVISTHTIALQEQLVHKDIPQLIKALNLNLKAVLVKGMNNYLCLRKLQDTQNELHLFPMDEGDEMQKIEAWQRNTSTGSRSELSFIPTQGTWERVSAEGDACSRQECPHYQQCYFFKARRQANEAQILVVNHSLLFIDLIKRFEIDNYTDPTFMPSYRRVILDEAHHIEEIATDRLAVRLNRLELLRTLGRLAAEKQNNSYGKLPLLKEKLQQIYKKAPPREISSILQRLTIDLAAIRRTIHDQTFHLFDQFDNFLEHINTKVDGTSTENKLRLLKEHHVHANWNSDILPHAKIFIDTILKYSQGLRSLEMDIENLKNSQVQEQTKSVRLDIQALTLRLEKTASDLNNFIQPLEDPNQVRWVEAHKNNLISNIHLVDAKLDIAALLVDILFDRFPTIVLCSATLSTNQKFDFTKKRLGLDLPKLKKRVITEQIYDSPFDYKKQALFVVPSDLPPPTDPKFNDAANEKIWEVIQASRGNAFILFTSYAMLQSCFEALAQKLKENRYPVFKQGDEQRRVLLNKFASTDRSVLFGTDSFWEGVDVAGDALRCVIIVKLPFKVPSEPLIAARTEAITLRGGDPFFEYSVPSAIVKFKQGFGRLIRNKKDRGCIVCLDTRLITKGYGKQFLNSLPPCEKFYGDGLSVQKKMIEFYKKTHYLVKK